MLKDKFLHNLILYIYNYERTMLQTCNKHIYASVNIRNLLPPFPLSFPSILFFLSIELLYLSLLFPFYTSLILFFFFPLDSSEPKGEPDCVLLFSFFSFLSLSFFFFPLKLNWANR